MSTRNIWLVVSFLTTAICQAHEPPGQLIPTSQPVDTRASAKASITFRKVMSTASTYDDNFSHAVIAVSNEQKSLVSRNYIVAGSAAKIRWLREHPERQGNRLFSLDAKRVKPTRLPDSTTFGFVPNSWLAWFLICDGSVRFWDTQQHKELQTVFPHSLRSECAGPSPAISPDGKVMVTQSDNSLQFWDLKTLKPLSPKVEHDWAWNMKFSSDGKWLFTRSRRKLKILEPKTGKLVAGPFRYDLIADAFAYFPKNQHLVTFENNDRKDAAWNSVAVIRSGKNWSKLKGVEIVGHAREAFWINDKHLLIVADKKRPGQKPPYTYGRNIVYVVSLAKDKAEVETRLRHTWISNVAIAPDGRHFITTTRDATSCWRLGEKNPVWTQPSKHRVSFADADWVLLHHEGSVVVCSLASGKELWRKDNVIASRLDGANVWLCGEKGVEVWRAVKQQDE